MSVYLLQIDFPHTGPFASEMSEAFRALATSIAQEPGFLWKIWTENAETQEAGGWYAFDSEKNLQAYLTMHCERLASFGVENIRARVFTPNLALSAIDQFPVQYLQNE